MKVIFLDIDGVLKLIQEKGFNYRFEQRAVAALNEITAETGAELVISSTWRELGFDLPFIFKQNGVQARIAGYTPILPGYPRGTEIEAWLDTAPRPITRFVILDDDDDMGIFKPLLVQTAPEVGLTHREAKRAIELLGGHHA